MSDKREYAKFEARSRLRKMADNYTSIRKEMMANGFSAEGAEHEEEVTARIGLAILKRLEQYENEVNRETELYRRRLEILAEELNGKFEVEIE